MWYNDLSEQVKNSWLIKSSFGNVLEVGQSTHVSEGIAWYHHQHDGINQWNSLLWFLSFFLSILWSLTNNVLSVQHNVVFYIFNVSFDMPFLSR